jgi:uncharacterized membrane protein YgcG
MKYKCGKCGKTKDYKFSCNCDESDDLIDTVVDIVSIGMGISSILSDDNNDDSPSTGYISNNSTNDFEGFGGGDFGGGGAGDDW